MTPMQDTKSKCTCYCHVEKTFVADQGMFASHSKADCSCHKTSQPEVPEWEKHLYDTAHGVFTSDGSYRAIKVEDIRSLLATERKKWEKDLDKHHDEKLAKNKAERLQLLEELEEQILTSMEYQKDENGEICKEPNVYGVHCGLEVALKLIRSKKN